MPKRQREIEGCREIETKRDKGRTNERKRNLESKEEKRKKSVQAIKRERRKHKSAPTELF